MLEAAAAYKKAGLSFERHAVAITEVGSKLNETAKNGGWLAILPMWSWIGGRMSVMSAVGLLPAALQGIDIEELLKGAAQCDEVTRSGSRLESRGTLALACIMPRAARFKGYGHPSYKDRLMLFAKYLQQLVMESLGKERT
jgi:glucose-6-phosphate isomerase